MTVETNEVQNSGKVRKVGPSATKFCQAWQNSENLKEVCEKTGMDSLSASQRAVNYRKKGVNLKCFQKGGGRRLDVAALNAVLGGTAENTENQAKTTETATV